jgi:DNA (cytosine-5)-methyltransferase 1
VFIVATKAKDLTPLTRIEPTKPFHSQRVVWAFDQLGADLQARWRWWKLDYPPAGETPLSSLLDDDDKVSWFDEAATQRIRALLNDLHKKKLSDAQDRGERVVGTLFKRMRIENKVKVQRAELRFDDCAGCLRTPRGGSSRQVVVVVHGQSVKARRLTPSEAARLMGLGPDYTLPKRSTAALEVLGDGVVVPVVSFLRANLLTPLANLHEVQIDAQKDKREVANTR